MRWQRTIAVASLLGLVACARLRAPEPTACVVVSPPRVRSADARWLAHAIYFTLTENLAKVEGLRVVAATGPQPPSLPPLCRRVAMVCRLESARLLVELTASDPATGAAVVRRTISGTQEEILAMVARVAEIVIEAINTRVILWDGQPFVRPAPEGERLVLSSGDRDRLRTFRTESAQAFVAFWKAVASDDPQEKRRWLDAAINYDPDYAAPYLARGILDYQTGDPERAAADLRKALDLGPRTPELFHALGLAHLALGKPGEAIGAFDEALAMRPDDPHVLVARAMAWIRRGDNHRAIADSTRAMGLSPSLAAARLARGKARLAAGDLAGATADFSAALALEPDSPEALLQRACAHHRSGRHAEAIADYSRVLALDPDNVIALRGRGLCRQARGDHEGAIADLSRAITLEPEDPLAYYGRALALAATGKYRAALRDALEASKRGAAVPETFIQALRRRSTPSGGSP